MKYILEHMENMFKPQVAPTYLVLEACELYCLLSVNFCMSWTVKSMQAIQLRLRS